MSIQDTNAHMPIETETKLMHRLSVRVCVYKLRSSNWVFKGIVTDDKIEGDRQAGSRPETEKASN